MLDICDYLAAVSNFSDSDFPLFFFLNHCLSSLALGALLYQKVVLLLYSCGFLLLYILGQHSVLLN